MHPPYDGPTPVIAPRWITQNGLELTPHVPAIRHFDFERLLTKLPPGIRASLNEGQLDAISVALIPEPTQHPFNYRISVSLLGRRYYLAILAGRERRAHGRLLEGGHVAAQRLAAFYVCLCLLGGCLGFAGIA